METTKNVQQDQSIEAKIEAKVALEIEELEPIIAPGKNLNHNETLIEDFAR